MQRSDRRTGKNRDRGACQPSFPSCVCTGAPAYLQGGLTLSAPIHVSQVLWVSNPHSLTPSCDPGVTAHLGCLNHSSPFLASLNLGLEELKVTQKFKHLKTQKINS